MSIALATTRLLIRPLSEQDLASFADYRHQPAVAKFQSWQHYQLADAQQLYQHMMQVPFASIGHWFQLAITDKLNGQLLGDLALHFVDEQQMELGFTLAPQYQGNGFALEAVQAIMRYLFVTLNKRRVIAVTDVLNLASIRLLQQLNFRQEAHFVENIWFKGAWGSEYQFALLKSEWQANNQTSTELPPQANHI
jgi:RimJ/RimL family protein N-acetyltransferase